MQSVVFVAALSLLGASLAVAQEDANVEELQATVRRSLADLHQHAATRRQQAKKAREEQDKLSSEALEAARAHVETQHEQEQRGKALRAELAQAKWSGRLGIARLWKRLAKLQARLPLRGGSEDPAGRAWETLEALVTDLFGELGWALEEIGALLEGELAFGLEQAELRLEFQQRFLSQQQLVAELYERSVEAELGRRHDQLSSRITDLLEQGNEESARRLLLEFVEELDELQRSQEQEARAAEEEWRNERYAQQDRNLEGERDRDMSGRLLQEDVETFTTELAKEKQVQEELHTQLSARIAALRERLGEDAEPQAAESRENTPESGENSPGEEPQTVEERLAAHEVSLDFRGTPVGDVADFLQEISGIPYIVRDLRGDETVRLRLGDLPFNTALDQIVLNIVDLQDERVKACWLVEDGQVVFALKAK